jgi:SAM-dependent methyltransferase
MTDMNDEMMQVDPSNAAQLDAWDGTEGEYWASHAERFDRSIAAHHRPFLDAAAIGPAEHVLDIGCGAGQATREAARAASAGTALGIDLSSRMLAYAAERAAAEGITNVTFVHADAQVHPFDEGAFDVAISRHAAMFFGDHEAAFRNIHRAVRSGGRLVLLTWQPVAGNEWLREIATALAGGREPRLPPPGCGPFALSEPGRVREVLEGAGFTDVSLHGVEEPMWFGESADDAYEFIMGLSGWMLDDLDDDEREVARAALRASTVAHESDHGVTFDAATWVVTAVRRP